MIEIITKIYHYLIGELGGFWVFIIFIIVPMSIYGVVDDHINVCRRMREEEELERKEREERERESVSRKKIQEENERKARDREQWEEQLHREIIREEALAKVRNTSMIEMYKTQVDLMMKYKKEGANIDKDIFAMREKLLLLEGQENKAMVQDLMNTLNGL
jgi:hypothetical protein